MSQSYHFDPRFGLRDHFRLPRKPDGSPAVYFLGNSLGLQPLHTQAYLQEILQDWERLGVEGHFKAPRPWMHYAESLAPSLARLAGAHPDEVVAMNSLTVNLHLMLTTFYRPTPRRYKVVVEGDLFPSDRYALASQVALHGFDPAHALVPLQPRPGEVLLRSEDLVAFLEEEGASVALVLLGGVNYYTGQAFDLAAITRAGRAAGCVVGFDLAHAIGNIPLRLHDWGVDFAVWCSYKYLNAGPGGIGGAFVHRRHHAANLPRLAGWWGQDPSTRFLMPDRYAPTAGASGWQVSTPPMLLMASLRASLDHFDAIPFEALRKRSKSLTAYLEASLQTRLPAYVDILTPSDPDARGCQLSLRLKGDARATFRALTDAHVFCDWREPDAIRVAPVPLYNTKGDIDAFVDHLEACFHPPTPSVRPG